MTIAQWNRLRVGDDCTNNELGTLVRIVEKRVTTSQVKRGKVIVSVWFTSDQGHGMMNPRLWTKVPKPKRKK